MFLVIQDFENETIWVRIIYFSTKAYGDKTDPLHYLHII